MSVINPGESSPREHQNSPTNPGKIWRKRFARLASVLPFTLALAGCPADLETSEEIRQGPTAVSESEKDLPSSTSAINLESYFARTGGGRDIFMRFIGEYYHKDTHPKLSEVEDSLITTIISFDPNLSTNEMERIMAIFAYEGILLKDPNLNPILVQIQDKAVRGEYANIINSHKQSQGIEPAAPVTQPRERGHLSEWADRIWPERIDSVGPENIFFGGDYVALNKKLPSSDTLGLTDAQRNLLIGIEEETLFLLEKRERATFLDQQDPQWQYNIRHAERGLLDLYNTLALNHPDLAFPDAATRQEYYRTREELYQSWLMLNDLFIQLETASNDEVHRASLQLSIQTAAGDYISRFDQARNLYPLAITPPDNLHPEVRAKIEQQLLQIRQQQKQYYIERLGEKTGESAIDILGRPDKQGMMLVLAPRKVNSSA